VNPLSRSDEEWLRKAVCCYLIPDCLTARQYNTFGGRLMMWLMDEKQPQPDEDEVVLF
jgi:hypothetical protein